MDEKERIEYFDNRVTKFLEGYFKGKVYHKILEYEDCIEYIIELDNGRCYKEKAKIIDIISSFGFIDNFCNMIVDRIEEDHLKEILK